MAPRTNPLPGYTEEEWAALSSQRRSDLRHADARRAYFASWHQANKVRRYTAERDRLKLHPETRLAWVNENRDRLRAHDRKREEKDGDKRRERRRKYYQDHREQFLAKKHRRRLWANESGGHFTASQFNEVKAKYGFKCLCCGRMEPEIKLTPDHVLPLVRGGTNAIGNIQPLCLRCNQRKGRMHLDYRPDSDRFQPLAVQLVLRFE